MKSGMSGMVVTASAVVLLGAGFGHASTAHAQANPPRGTRLIGVGPQQTTAAEVLRPGLYNIWVKRVGGAWKAYTKVRFEKGGPPRHLTIYQEGTDISVFRYTDFIDGRYTGTPAANEFYLHLENRSLTHSAVFAFRRTGPIPPEPAAPAATSSKFPNLSGKWIGYNPGMKRQGPCSITQSGANISLVSEVNTRAEGKFESSSSILTNWNGTILRGHITSDGRRINWENGTWWVRQ